MLFIYAFVLCRSMLASNANPANPGCMDGKLILVSITEIKVR